MKILILSGYDDAMKEVGDRCTATHKAYAERHGYAHEVVREYLPGTHPSYQKIRLLKERIDRFDAIMWLDADSVVMNMRRSILPPLAERVMDISVDWCAPVEDDSGFLDYISTTYVSCGNFVLWNTIDTARFIFEWEAHSSRYAARQVCCWEQDGLRSAMQAEPWFDLLVYRWARREFNAVHPTCSNRNFPNGAPKPYQDGDFLLHLTNVDRIAILNQLGL